MGNIAINPVFCYVKTFSKRDPFFQIIEKKNLRDLMEKIYSKYQKNPGWLINHMGKMRKLSLAANDIWKFYQENKNNLTWKDLLDFYDRIIEVLQEWCMYSASGEDKGQTMGEKITNFLIDKHRMDILTASKAVPILTHPSKTSALNQERMDYLRISLRIFKKFPAEKSVSKLLKDKKIEKMAEEYLKNYFWIKGDFYGVKKITPRSLLSEIIHEINGKKESDILKELNKFSDNILKIKKEKNKLLSRLNLSAEEKKCLKFSEYMIFQQDLRKIEMMQKFFYIFSFFSDIAKKLGTNYDEIAACSVSEVRNILIGRRRINKKTRWLFVHFARGRKTEYFSGRTAKKMFDEASKLNIGKSEKNIKGMIASSGGMDKVSGIVRIISNPDKQKFSKGEILVTSMTRTEFLTLMRKAKAIITNEGGIACHAAIVSRELGIPCIIGTKIATKVLKNGDKVEMDLRRGIVRVLK